MNRIKELKVPEYFFKMMKSIVLLTLGFFAFTLATVHFGRRGNSANHSIDSTNTLSTLALDLRSENKLLYNEHYHKLRDKDVPSNFFYGKRFFPLLAEIYPSTLYPEWFDAGCGNCATLRFLRKKGYRAYGSDVAESNLKKHCPDFIKKRIAVAATLADIPFPDDKFDVVFSADVLEHIPHTEIPSVVKELVRVSKTGVIFLSISQRLAKFDPDPPEAAKIHITLRPRSWWDDHFRESECYPNYDVLRKFQRKLPKSLGPGLQRKVNDAKRGREFWNELNETEPWVFPYICKK